MNKILNQDTGLFEMENYFRGLPQVFQRGTSNVKFRTRLKAAHQVPTSNGMNIDFLSRLSSGKALYVVFHGAIAPERLYYPRFEREQSLKELGVPALHFADPTLQYSKSQEMRLSWYLGGPGWDPIYNIASIVRTAMRQIGTKNVAFIGGSGGGFTALRISAMFEGSLAFVQDPQTSVSRYYIGAIKRYFETVWPGQDRNRLMSDFPDRFDVCHLYKEYAPQNYVYYYQAVSDEFHRKSHYNPYLIAVGGTQGGRSFENNNRKLVLVNGELEGHGKITANEFDAHFEAATNWWLGKLR